jgi:hypothetical protein
MNLNSLNSGVIPAKRESTLLPQLAPSMRKEKINMDVRAKINMDVRLRGDDVDHIGPGWKN